MTGHWRPTLLLVLAGALAGTLSLSFSGLVALRYLGPEIGFRNAALVLGALILAATALLGWLLARLLLRPIRSLELYAGAVQQAGGAPVASPRHFGTRELHRTALSVLAMARTLQDREATVRSYTDHVTHELRTPVSAIRAAVELIQDGGSAERDRPLLAEIDGAARQIEAQLQALAQAARARETRYLGRCTLDQLLPGLAAETPQLALEPSGGAVPVPIAAEGLGIVLRQLLRNAAEHRARRVRLAARAGPGGVELTVSDDGAGISEGNAARLFEPFFTTRREAGGTGMGLTIARNILAAHGGEIRHQPAPGPGASFRLLFPGPGDPG